MRNATVILLCGLPGSGKSSIARRLTKELTPQCSALHIEYDVLEEEIMSSKTAAPSESNLVHGHSSAQPDKTSWDLRKEAWNQARSDANKKLACQLEMLSQSEDEERISVFLLDDNYHLRGMRKEIHRLLLGHASSLQLHFGILWLDVPFATCVEHNNARSDSRRVPMNTMEKMKHSFEPPRMYWEVNYLRMTEDTGINTILSFIRSCPSILELEYDVPTPEEIEIERAKTLQNRQHSLDKQLREWVGTIARFDKAYAGKANGARKIILQKLKQSNDTELKGPAFDAVPFRRVFIDLLLGDDAEDDDPIRPRFESLLL